MANSMSALMLLLLSASLSTASYSPASEVAVSTHSSNEYSIFDRFGVPYAHFQIIFRNLHVTYSMAAFPTDLHTCANALLLVFIPTRPTSFNIRNAIRSSWVKDKPSNVVVKFMIGQHLDPDMLYLLLGEQKMFGDLILYDIEDNYLNLFLKVHAAFNWQQSFCKQVKYILKTDDDTIVDLNRLVYWIENEFSRRQRLHPAIIFGRLGKGVKPIRTEGKKWYVSYDSYPSTYYPPFVYGGTYLMSSEAISAILSNTQRVTAIFNEDVLFTGIVSNRAGVVRENAAIYFRGDRKVEKREKCSNNVPLLTEIYGFYNVTEFDRYYDVLRSVQCDG